MAYTSDEVIRALYLSALGREPEAMGLRAYGDILAKGGSLKGLFDTILSSSEYRTRTGRASLPDHSQFGEYKIVLQQIANDRSSPRIVVDVGARGRDRSNSYDLLRDLGWRGLLVEANPSLYGQIEGEFAGTDFSLVRCAVGTETGTLPFHIGVNDDVSSLMPDHATAWGDVRGTVEVEVRRLVDILTEHRIPRDFDLLSLDIEGMDAPVLNDLIQNSDFRPKLIVVELQHDGQTEDLTASGLSHRVGSIYELVARTAANLVLRKRAS